MLPREFGMIREDLLRPALFCAQNSDTPPHRYADSRMKHDAATPSEFDKFTRLVDSVLSVPKTKVDKRINEERCLKDLQYLKQDIETDERRKSQIIPSK